jgi:hypothetical protein
MTGGCLIWGIAPIFLNKVGIEVILIFAAITELEHFCSDRIPASFFVFN